MSFTFLENAFDNDKPFFSGGPAPGSGQAIPQQQMGGPPAQDTSQHRTNPYGPRPQRMGAPNNLGLSEMSQYPPTQGTPYGAPKSGPPAYHPMNAQPHPPPRSQPISSGAPMEYQEVPPPQHQQKQQEELERRQYEQLYAMGKFVTKQQEDNALVLRSMKQYSSSLEILLFIVIAFCVVMVIVQIVVCRKVMTLTKMTQANNS